MQEDDRVAKIKKKQDCIEALGKDEDYAVEKFDTLIVSLSSGGLVFSVAFVKDVIKNFRSIDLTWLKVCWIFFALALIASLGSQVTGYFSNKYEKRALKNQIKQLNGAKEVKGSLIETIISNLQKRSDFFASSTDFLNMFCFLSFIIAVSTLVYFIYSNV